MNRVEYRIGKNDVLLEGFLHQSQEDLSSLYDKRPAIIICPGGGYSRLSKREQDPVSFAFFAAGYNVFVLHYSVGEEIRSSWPEKELAIAVSTLREDCDRLCIKSIAVLGFSAGGHACASLACHWKKYGDRSRPDAAVLCYPVITTGEYAHRMSADYVSMKNPDLLSYFDLPSQVSEDTVPCLIWHTAEDRSVPVENSLLLASALSNAKVPFELHVYQEGEHGLSMGTNETGRYNKHVQSWFALALEWLSERFSFVL